MFLLVGLGNPGAKYELNRHNIGFLTLDAIFHEYGFSSWQKKYSSMFAIGNIASHKVILLKPQTYMNKSGIAVRQAKQFYKIDNSNVIVFHDELDLAPLKLKYKIDGGHGGHNGLRDISAHIGADFYRLRMGIGHPGNKDMVASYVLQNFSKLELTNWQDGLDFIAKNVTNLLDDDSVRFLNDYALNISQ